MRTEGIKVYITIPIPYGRPDCNGVVHTKESVQDMIGGFGTNKPLVFKANEYDIEHCIGLISGNDYAVTWDDKLGTCWLNVNGLVFYGGADIVVNEMQDGKVTSFEVRSVGLSE